MRKKMKMTIAATRAPISGRASSRFDQPSVTRLDASGGAEGDGSVLTGVLLMTAPVLFGGGRALHGPGPLEAVYRVFCLMNGRTWAMFALSTKEGPVSTAWPPPRTLPFFLNR